MCLQLKSKDKNFTKSMIKEEKKNKKPAYQINKLLK